jgi:hypothetical protein
MPNAPLLLIDVGDLPSLVAALIQPDPARLVLFHPQTESAAAQELLAAAREHERILSPAGFIVGRVGSLISTNEAAPAQARWLNELSIASSAAIASGCGGMIWPVQIGIDAEGVGRAMETAQLVGDICGLGDPTGEGLHVKLPLADRTDQEVVMLSEELGVPERAFWPCEGSGKEPCGRCGSCRRWMTAFGAARTAWPWAAVAAR